MADSLEPLREQLIRALDWNEAHATFDTAVGGIEPGQRGARPEGFEHSPWQLIEHMRLAQRDLLDFCVNPHYSHTMTWPDDYWPRDPAPPSDSAWDTALSTFTHDRDQLKIVVRNPDIDLFRPVPTGNGQQTYLRSVLLIIDHNAYHVGQLVAVRQALGNWR
jgi:hypothetical protein